MNSKYAGNGSSLEDCHTNIFALADLNGLKWKKYLYSKSLSPTNSSLFGLSPSFHTIDKNFNQPNTINNEKNYSTIRLSQDPLLSSYCKCLESSVLCVWRLRPGDSLDSNFIDRPKELWIFWHGDEPDFSILIHRDLKESEFGNWDNGLTYEGRTLLFKAFHNIIERYLMMRGFLRLGKWFVEPKIKGNDSDLHSEDGECYNSPTNQLAFSLAFFLHGESAICASLIVQKFPSIYRLILPENLGHTQHYKPLNVIMCPYGLSGILTGKYFKSSDAGMEDLLEEWQKFYPNIQSDNNSSPNDSKYPPSQGKNLNTGSFQVAEIMIADKYLTYYPIWYVSLVQGDCNDIINLDSDEYLTPIYTKPTFDSAKDLNNTNNNLTPPPSPANIINKGEFLNIPLCAEEAFIRSNNNFSEINFFSGCLDCRDLKSGYPTRHDNTEWTFVNASTFKKCRCREAMQLRSDHYHPPCHKARFNFPFGKEITPSIEKLQFNVTSHFHRRGCVPSLSHTPQFKHRQRPRKRVTIISPKDEIYSSSTNVISITKHEVASEHDPTFTHCDSNSQSTIQPLRPTPPSSFMSHPPSEFLDRHPSNPCHLPYKTESTLSLTSNNPTQILDPDQLNFSPLYTDTSVYKRWMRAGLKNLRNENSSFNCNDGSAKLKNSNNLYENTFSDSNKESMENSKYQKIKFSSALSFDPYEFNEEFNNHNSRQNSNNPYIEGKNCQTQQNPTSVNGSYFPNYRPPTSSNQMHFVISDSNSNDMYRFTNTNIEQNAYNVSNFDNQNINNFNKNQQTTIPPSQNASQNIFSTFGIVNKYQNTDPIQLEKIGSPSSNSNISSLSKILNLPIGSNVASLNTSNISLNGIITSTDLSRIFPTPPSLESNTLYSPCAAPCNFLLQTPNATSGFQAIPEITTSNNYDKPFTETCHQNNNAPLLNNSAISYNNNYLSAKNDSSSIIEKIIDENRPLNSNNSFSCGNTTIIKTNKPSSLLWIKRRRYERDNFLGRKLKALRHLIAQSKVVVDEIETLDVLVGFSPFSKISKEALICDQMIQDMVDVTWTMHKSLRSKSPSKTRPPRLDYDIVPATIAQKNETIIPTTLPVITFNSTLPIASHFKNVHSLLFSLHCASLLDTHSDSNLRSCSLCACNGSIWARPQLERGPTDFQLLANQSQALLDRLRSLADSSKRAGKAMERLKRLVNKMAIGEQANCNTPHYGKIINGGFNNEIKPYQNHAHDNKENLRHKCICGFDPDVNRSSSFESGLFFEDEMLVNGERSNDSGIVPFKTYTAYTSFLNIVYSIISNKFTEDDHNIFNDIQRSEICLTDPETVCMVQSLVASDPYGSTVLSRYSPLNFDITHMTNQPSALRCPHNIRSMLDTSQLFEFVLSHSIQSGEVDSNLFDEGKNVKFTKRGTIFSPYLLFTAHFWPFLYDSAPPANRECVNAANYLRAALRDCVERRPETVCSIPGSASRFKSSHLLFEQARQVSGPLTWQHFHKLAGRGRVERCEPQPIPPIVVGYEHERSLVSPLAINFWEFCNFEPFSLPKEVNFIVVVPDNATLCQITKRFFENLSCSFELCKMGKHTPLTPFNKSKDDYFLRVGQNFQLKTASMRDMSYLSLFPDWINSLGSQDVMEKIRCYYIAFKYQLATYLHNNQRSSFIEEGKAVIHQLLGGSTNQEASLSIKVAARHFFESFASRSLVVYAIDPYSFFKNSHRSPAVNISGHSIARCFYQALDSLPGSYRDRITFKIIPIQSMLDALSCDRSIFRTFSLSIYASIRYCQPVIQGPTKTYTGFGPSVHKNCVLEKNKATNYYNNADDSTRLVKFYAPPFILSPKNAFLNPALAPINKGNFASFNDMSSSKNIPTPENYSTQHAISSVLYCGYCLSSDQRWLLATFTDETGSMLESCMVNIDVANRYRKKEMSLQKAALEKLLNFAVYKIICRTNHSWRIIIGRVGRLGHGELKVWCDLLSKRHIKQINYNLTQSCKPCHLKNKQVAPCAILSACLVSIQPNNNLRVFPDSVAPELDRMGTSKYSPLTTPKDISTTHILVFPISAHSQSTMKMGLEEDYLYGLSHPTDAHYESSTRQNQQKHNFKEANGFDTSRTNSNLSSFTSPPIANPDINITNQFTNANTNHNSTAFFNGDRHINMNACSNETHFGSNNMYQQNTMINNLNDNDIANNNLQIPGGQIGGFEYNYNVNPDSSNFQRRSNDLNNGKQLLGVGVEEEEDLDEDLLLLKAFNDLPIDQFLMMDVDDVIAMQDVEDTVPMPCRHSGQINKAANNVTPVSMLHPHPCSSAATGNIGTRPPVPDEPQDSLFMMMTSCLLQQQPLALGYYVSTSPVYHFLPRWFASGLDPWPVTRVSFLNSSLHINSASVMKDSEEVDYNRGTNFSSLNFNTNSSSSDNHSLDSGQTTDILRFVLEGYNRLSWLVVDPYTRDRTSCLPIHIQILLNIYHLLATFKS
ncbi:unnamed protein product [Gordionus sp. m RMFG-2023]|uniref:uncharacterized protein LOC135925070 isoform X2 n=1 Tax=Gordionus sp. m RMFG-2023 TaxID=3053472 RepID=UPI0030E0AC23